MELTKLIEILTMLKNDGYEEVKIKVETSNGVIETDIEITEKRLEGQINLYAKGYEHAIKN